MSRQPRRLALDSSALLALIERAPGSERVRAALRRDTTLIPWPALVELHYISVQQAGGDEASRRYALIRGTSARIQWDADEQLTLTAARVKASHRVSFADALIAAYAIREKATLLHREPEFESVEGLSTEMLPARG